MGVDEALFATARATGIPSLRFYGWTGPWLSLGYAQTLADDHLARLAEAGVGCVRRVTGGRAVLHGADLTYAIAAPEGVLPPGVRASYGVVADALLGALARLGVTATRSHASAPAAGKAVFDCFAQPAADEICLGERKLSGSAQRRVGGALLQHGSIRLSADPERVARAATPDGRGLGGTSLAESGHPVSRAALERACLAAFADALGAHFELAELEPGEVARVLRRGLEPDEEARLPDAPRPAIPANS
jgi:lipoate-protein ligase A